MDPIKVLPCYSITIFTLKHSLHVHLNGSIIKTIMAAVTAKGDVRTYYLSSTTDKVTDVPADYTVVNVLKWTGTPWINLCPFLLKTDGRESLAPPKGIIFENFWQGTKVFSAVYPQQQYASKFHQGKPEHLWFSHQMKGSLLQPDGKLDLVKYHKW